MAHNDDDDVTSKGYIPPTFLYQSINQSNLYSAINPGVARLSGATARPVFKCEFVEVVP